MCLEYYTISFDGVQVRLSPCTADALPANAVAADDYAPVAPYAPVWRLGDAEHLWCEAFRASGERGGVLVVRDFDQALLAVRADSHLAFVEGLGHFAHMVTYGRYAADIFEHMDEDDDV